MFPVAHGVHRSRERNLDCRAAAANLFSRVPCPPRGGRSTAAFLRGKQRRIPAPRGGVSGEEAVSETSGLLARALDTVSGGDRDPKGFTIASRRTASARSRRPTRG